MTETNPRPRLFLRTFGAPDLVGVPRELTLRAKDLGLLVFLRLTPPTAHRRTVLAGLLWAENSERGARHSLTQAVVRLRKVLGERAILTTRETVVWAGELACDAAMLEEAARGDTPSLLAFYGGEFLEGLALGAGTQAYENWVAARRVEYRDLAADLADRWGADAEARGEWQAALQYAQRAVQIDPYLEASHRRIMRALAAMGERNRALQHYMQYAAMVRREMGLAPETETTALEDSIRGGAPLADPDLEPDSGPGPAPGPDPLPDPDPGPGPGDATAAAPDASAPAIPSPKRDAADAAPGTPPASSDPDDPAAARRKWVTAGVLAASVLLAFAVARGGIRA